MPKRCSDPLCGNLIKQGLEYWVEDKPFCDEECAMESEQQSFDFDVDCCERIEGKRKPARIRMNGSHI